MSEKNNDIMYSARDIEKYHQGLLSTKEMHAMEKAALDDPFLADAMEGYRSADISMETELADLKKRLAGRTEDKKTIPFAQTNKSSFRWLRVAAMIIAVSGAGLLIYQLGFKDGKTKNIALEQTPVKGHQPIRTEKEELGDEQVAETTAEAPSPGSAKGNKTPIAKPSKQENIERIPGVAVDKMDNIQTSPAAPDRVAETQNSLTAKTVNTEPKAVPMEFKKEMAKSNDAKFRNNDYSKQYSYDRRTDSALPDNRQGNAVALGSVRNDQQSRSRNQGYFQSNQFRGQVRDANNNALPFANITNVDDNVGTYSDAQGRFVLTSPDTVLNVQVRSLGFESNTLQIRNNVPSNQVILRDDDKSLSEVVVSNKKVNSSRARNQAMVLEEPEPADGWENYDTYLSNNLNPPESFKSKETNSGNSVVELSFEVNKDGEPINIKVVKSLCDKCDKEAIRLLKEGPKWKRKVKKGRTSVKIAF